MGRIVVTEFVSLDGVMEDPGVGRFAVWNISRVERGSCSKSH